MLHKVCFWHWIVINSTSAAFFNFSRHGHKTISILLLLPPVFSLVSRVWPRASQVHQLLFFEKRQFYQWQIEGKVKSRKITKNKHLRSCGYFAFIWQRQRKRQLKINIWEIVIILLLFLLPLIPYFWQNNIGEVRYTWTNLVRAADLNVGELEM